MMEESIEERSPSVTERNSLQNSKDNAGKAESQGDSLKSQTPEEETSELTEETVAKGEHIPAGQLSSNLLPDSTVNASVISASELPFVGDKTITGTVDNDLQEAEGQSPEEEHVVNNEISTETKENDKEGNEISTETKENDKEGNEISTEAKENDQEWMDVLGNGQLMKRVRTDCIYRDLT